MVANSPQPLAVIQVDFSPQQSKSHTHRPGTAESTRLGSDAATCERPASSLSASRPGSRTSGSHWAFGGIGDTPPQQQQQHYARPRRSFALPGGEKREAPVSLQGILQPSPRGEVSEKGARESITGATEKGARRSSRRPNTAGASPGLPPADIKPQATKAERAQSSTLPVRPNSVAEGAAQVAELTRLLHPMKLDEGFRSTFARLGFAIKKSSREWQGARLQKNQSEEKRSPTFVHSMEAASLLLQMVLAMPRRMPEREMLEPVLLEFMHAVFRDWPQLTDLDELSEDDVQAASLAQLSPWLALVEGQRAIAEEALSANSAAQADAEEARSNEAVMRGQLEIATGRLEQLERQLASYHDAIAVLRAENTSLAMKADHEAEERAKRQSMYLDCSEQLRDRVDDLRVKSNELVDLKRRHAEVLSQIDTLRQTNTELDRKVHKLQSQLTVAEAASAEVPKLKFELEHYQAAEAVRGTQFAARVAHEVLGTDLETLCRKSRAVSLAKAQVQTAAVTPSSKAAGGELPPAIARAMLDTVREKLKALPSEIKALKEKNELLRREAKAYSQLVPVYNSEFANDLADAYNENAPIHRQVFSMKDCRSFAGLGLREDVPPYLRVEGFVRHVFKTKVDMEQFMSEFMTYFCEGRREEDINSDLMHLELHNFLKKRYESSDELHEFAYAFICSLEAFRTDPDFELFDLMLSGAVHPSIMQDHRQMLSTLEALLRSCTEEPLEPLTEPAAAAGAPQLMPPKCARAASTPAGATGGASPSSNRGFRLGAEQVNRRTIRCALQVMCPEKTQDFHNALQRALHATLQILTDAAKTPSTDSCYINDLFASNADETQTPFIEEVRRQHYIEVVRFTSKLARRLQEAAEEHCSDLVTQDMLMEVLEEVDPKAKPQRFTELRKIAFTMPAADSGSPEENSVVAVAAPPQQDKVHHKEVMRRLRRATLLRPARLWVSAEAKDVVQRICDPAQQDADSMQQLSNSKQCICGAVFLDDVRYCRRCGVERPEEEAAKPEWKPTRVRGLKVLQPHSQRGDPYADTESERRIENLRTPWMASLEESQGEAQPFLSRIQTSGMSPMVL